MTLCARRRSGHPGPRRSTLLPVLATVGLSLSAPRALAVKVSDFEARVYKNAAGETLPYRLFVPRNRDPNRSYPLVLFLHGAGERGTDNVIQISQPERIVFAEEKHQARNPCFFLAPQCPVTSWWTGSDFVIPAPNAPLAKPLRLTLEIVDALMKEFAIDPDRVYVTGLSMGGFATWTLLEKYPDRFAAGVPIAGAGNVAGIPLAAMTPIWDFHGDADTTVDPAGSRKMAIGLWDIGVPERYSEYPGVGHDSWTRAYAEPALAPWLFSKQRVHAPPPTPSGLSAATRPLPAVDLTWTPGDASPGDVREYRIYRDGAIVGRSRIAAFTDTAAPEGRSAAYAVSAVGGSGLESVPSAPLSVAVPVDATPPSPVEAVASSAPGPSSIEVRFDEPVDPSSATDPLHFMLAPVAAVTGVTPGADPRSFLLSAGPLPGGPLTLTVSGVRDRAASPNAVSSASIPVVRDPHLVARWRMDAEGKALLDLSGHGSVPDGSVASGPGRDGGRALEVDGTAGGSAAVPLRTAIDPSGPLTVAAWIKKIPGSPYPQAIVARAGPSAGTAQFALELDESGRVRVRLMNDARRSFRVAGRRLDALDWHHVLFVDANGTVELYVDGAFNGRSAIPGNLVASDGPVLLGGYPSSREPFHGLLDDVRIYDRALDPAEIRALAGERPEPRADRGDLNEDGFVDATDAYDLLLIVLGVVPGTKADEFLGDVNGDGRLDLQDARLILRTMIGL